MPGDLTGSQGTQQLAQKGAGRIAASRLAALQKMGNEGTSEALDVSVCTELAVCNRYVGHVTLPATSRLFTRPGTLQCRFARGIPEKSGSAHEAWSAHLPC